MTNKLKILSMYATALLLVACGGGGGSSGTTVVATPGAPGAATLTWIAPTLNHDGSTLSDLSGFRIYESASADVATLVPVATLTNPGLSSFMVENLSAGTHYFALTAVNSTDVESDMSNVASVNIGRQEFLSKIRVRRSPLAACMHVDGASIGGVFGLSSEVARFRGN